MNRAWSRRKNKREGGCVDENVLVQCGKDNKKVNSRIVCIIVYIEQGNRGRDFGNV